MNILYRSHPAML